MMSDSLRWLWLVGIFLTGWLVYLLTPILPPFLVAMLLAYLGDPLVDRLERLKLSRSLGVALVFLLFAVVVAVLLLIFLPLLGRQLMRLYELTPQMLDWLQHSAMPWLQVQLGLSADFWQFDRLKAAVADNPTRTSDILGALLLQVTQSSLALVGFIGNLLLVPIVSFYLMRDWDVLMRKLRSLLPRRREGLVLRLTAECHEVLGAFVRGQLLVMLALATIYAAGLMLVGLELGLLIGLLAGLASIVPYMGLVVGLGAALVAVLFQFGAGDWYPLIGVLVVFTVGQLLEGMLLTPWLVGDRIGLHPVAVIFAILAGGQLFGFTGILLALPVAAVIMVLLRHVHDLYKLSELYGESPEVSQEASPPA